MEKQNVATELLHHTLTFPKLAWAVWPTKPFGNDLEYGSPLWINGKQNMATKLLHHTRTFPKPAWSVWLPDPFRNYLKYWLPLWINGKAKYGNRASTPHPNISNTGLGGVTSQSFKELFEIFDAFVDRLKNRILAPSFHTIPWHFPNWPGQCDLPNLFGIIGNMRCLCGLIVKPNMTTKLLHHTRTFPKLAWAVWLPKPLQQYLKYLCALWINTKT